MKGGNFLSKNSFQKKDETISFLIKQRDGLIVGDYRNILFNIYNRIKNACPHTSQCSIYDLFRCDSHEMRVFLDYCYDLEHLGYLKIEHAGSDIYLSPIQEINF